MTLPPEIRLAHRLAEHLDLRPPIDVAALIERYAYLEEVQLPVDVDGICLDLKVPGKTPRVIVNSLRPANRRRFTLAHELGHILIPWHVGSIVDEIEFDMGDDNDYWILENEANRFASELLMPRGWVDHQLQIASSPLKALESVVQGAAVSFQAASIKLFELMPAGHMIVELANDRVVSSRKSMGTLASMPAAGGGVFLDLIFPWADRWTGEINGRYFVWWKFPNDIPLQMHTNRDWRDIMTEIMNDLDNVESKKFKATLNGIIAYANGLVRTNRTPNTILSACLQRLHSNAIENLDILEFLQHERFNEFITARVQAFLK